MTTSTLLRVTAVVALLQFFGHAALFVRAQPTHGDAEVTVVAAMKAHRFNFGGSMRSYWDMYYGYGLEAVAVVHVPVTAHRAAEVEPVRLHRRYHGHLGVAVSRLSTDEQRSVAEELK